MLVFFLCSLDPDILLIQRNILFRSGIPRADGIVKVQFVGWSSSESTLKIMIDRAPVVCLVSEGRYVNRFPKDEHYEDANRADSE